MKRAINRPNLQDLKISIHNLESEPKLLVEDKDVSYYNKSEINPEEKQRFQDFKMKIVEAYVGGDKKLAASVI